MLNNIKRLSSNLNWKVPFFALSLAIGVFAETTNPVSASQMHHSQTASLNSQTATGSFSSYSSSSSSQSTNFFVNNNGNYSHNWDTSLRTVGDINQYQASISTSSLRKRTTLPQKDGVYLYGQSPQPGQLGKGYIIFERKYGRVTGALYMPSSEFSCFRGALRQNGKLAMTVNSYPGETSTSQVASVRGFSGTENTVTNYNHSVRLQNYYRLSSIGDSDRQVLQMCKG
ncbi:hypothetical protein [Mastigocoleus testarum]|uniref:Uncharacterized protein n=1 Tax=Mastigocoleus testarum BC008 TaxID=371196 RepID=A0A0V7ZXQ3_9CYAN|nr:hypothetical protein [Mastigocoleus testarum]KST69363.1 hypothetical protein BC008_04010 [Mastigocoleus testarum BC008]KST69516.1 hypothetical protein BC008_04245 [Mastigocoleus testarum BC008]